MANPERDGRQARRMRDRGWFNEDQLRKALTWPRAPGDDLVAVLLGRGLLTPESAEIIRRETESGAVLPTRPPSTRIDPSTPYGRRAGVPPTRVDSGSHALTRSSRATLPTRLGPWDLEKEIARGGMGSVHLARHAETGQVAALKLIHSGLSADAAERFEIEARAAGRLSHPGIVGILDAGEQEGTAYLVMEYVDGEALDQRIARTGPLPAEEAARLTIAVAEALDAAHGADVLHRDLKPANVLLSKTGEPRLTDFGLAKLQDGDGEGLTRTGEMIGTPQYMPPEQLQGEKHRIDRRADVYSLGATLYEMLAGRPPFMADSMMDTVVQVTMQAPEPPSRWEPEVPPELDAICLRCLAKAPDDRYHTAAELARDLDRFLAGDAIEAKLVKRGGAGRSLALLGVMLLLVGGLGFVIWQRSRPGAVELRTAGLSFDAEILAASPGAKTGEAVWRGRVPARVELPAGRYELRVRDSRLQPRPGKGDVFHVNPGQSAGLELEVIRRTGRLKVTAASKDKGLRFTATHVDDAALRRRSALPAELELPVGRWRLVVAGPGTLNESREVEIREGEESRLEVRPLQRELWRVKVNEGPVGNPVFYDPDRVGREDIFVTAGQALGRITRTGVRTWLVNNELIQRNLAVGDLLGDGRPGLITRSIAGKPVCFRVEESQIERLRGLSVTATAGPIPLKIDDAPGDDYLFVSEGRELVAYGPASRSKIFRRSFGETVMLPVALVDPAGPLKGASDADAVLCTTSGSSVLGLRRDGTDAWVRTVEGPLARPVLLHDTDGEVDLIAILSVAESPSLQTFRPDGSPAWSRALPAKPRGIMELEPRLGVRALAVVVEGGAMWLLDRDGKTLWERPGEPSDGVIGHWTAADFDGDGRQSVVLGGNRAGVAQISALDADGGLLWRHRGSVPLSSLNHADLNGDGFPELLVGCENGELFALTARRTPLQWRVASPARAVGPPVAFESGLLGPGGEWIPMGPDESAAGLAGEVQFAPRKTPFYPAFDAARGELLIPDIDGLSAWSPKDKVARSLIKRTGISSVSVIGDRLLIVDVTGAVAIHDLADDARQLHTLRVRGRVTAPAVPFLDEQGEPNRALLLSATGWHGVVDLKHGKLIGLMKSGGSVRWPALILDPGDTKRPCRFAVLRSDSMVEFYEALGDTLKRISSVRLDRVPCGPMTLLRKDGAPWRIAVPCFEGWIDVIDVTTVPADLVAVLREDQCLPYGTIAAVDVDRDGAEEAVVGWLQPVRNGPRGFVSVITGEGRELFRFGASTRCAQVLGAPDGSVLVFDTRVSRFGPWPKVAPAPPRSSSWEIIQLLASGAIAAAKARLETVDDPFLRKSLSAMSEALSGRKEPLVKIVKNKEEQPRFEELLQAWQTRGKTIWSEEQLGRLVAPFKTAEKPKTVELKALVKEAKASPVVHADFRLDPPTTRGAAVSVTDRVGFRPDRAETGLFVNVKGQLHFRFAVADEAKRRVRLLHRSLPNFGLGCSTLQISVDDKVVVKRYEAPWWGPFEEIVPLGKLEKGIHDLKFQVVDAGTVWSVCEVTIERVP